MTLFRQIGAVTAMNFKSLPHRVGTSIVIVIGIAGVVAVLVSVLAMSTGMLETMENSGRDDRAIVLRNGSAAESGSALGRDAARLVEDAAGVKRDSDGKPIASAEVAAPGESVPQGVMARKSTSRCAASARSSPRCARRSRSFRGACSAPP